MLNVIAILLSLICQVDYGIPTHKYSFSNEEMHIEYDPMTRNPRFVVEIINPKVLAKNVNRTYNPFKAEERLPNFIKVYPQDYIGSGYDRGHMAPAGNHLSSKESFEFTFFMTNMAPQLPDVNRRVWNYLESNIRFIAPNYSCGWIVTCPIYTAKSGPSTIDRIGDRIWIPTHFGKSLLLSKRINDVTQYQLHTFIVPNKVDVLMDYNQYRVTTDELEERTGLDLWSKFPVEPLESKL